MKRFLAGLLVGILITAASTAIAANKKIEATLAYYNYLINGQKVEVDAPALTVDGTSHLPTRALAEALGYDVDYDADTKTIILDEKEPAESDPIFDKIEQGGSEQVSNRFDDDAQVTETTFNDVFAINYNGEIYFQKFDFTNQYGNFELDFLLDGTVFIDYNGLVQELNSNNLNDVIIYKNQVYYHSRFFPENAEKIKQPVE